MPNFEALQHVRVVLCRPSHPANIGAAARAMKTMGLLRLYIVAPNLIATPQTDTPPVFDFEQPQAFKLPAESFILASGAADVLEHAVFTRNLSSALEGCTLAAALTSRKRELAAPLYTPRELASELLQVATQQEEVALVFGNETFGLSINEVASCNRLMTINGNPNYFSLNLAQAVQVVAYELFCSMGQPLPFKNEALKSASVDEVQGLAEHMKNVMHHVGFFERRNAERLMRRLHAVFLRAHLEREDIDILRGFLSTLMRRIK